MAGGGEKHHGGEAIKEGPRGDASFPTKNAGGGARSTVTATPDKRCHPSRSPPRDHAWGGGTVPLAPPARPRPTAPGGVMRRAPRQVTEHAMTPDGNTHAAAGPTGWRLAKRPLKPKTRRRRPSPATVIPATRKASRTSPRTPTRA